MTTINAAEPWQRQFEKVEQRCDYLFTSGKWSDCTFMVGSEPYKAEIPAHKLILAIASPVFEAMFYGWLSEDNERMIPIPDVQPEAFRALLKYIYTGHIDIDSFDMAWKLWHGAKKYELPHLVKQCNSYICSLVSPRNVCQSYEFAHFFKEKAIMDKCIEIISTKTKEVLNDSSFEDIELDTLITVLSLDHLNVDSELDLIHAVARYAKVEQKRQKPIGPPVDSDPPSEKLSELRLEPAPSEEKVLLNGEGSFETSPAGELDSKPQTEVVTAEPTSDTQNLKHVPERERPEPRGIRAAIEKIRFLSLSPQQFAESQALSFLTTAEAYSIIMNICSRDSEPMPTGFSESREPRQRIDVVDETPDPVAAMKFRTPAQIVQGLASIDLNKAAARAAREMLSEDTTTQLIRSQLVEAGAIPALVASLDPSHDLQSHAAGALAIIASGTREHTLAVVDAGAIPKLIALLGHGGDVAAQAASALGAIAEDGPVNRDAVLNLGALPAMLPYMHPNTPLTQLSTYVWTYCNMCWHENPMVSFELVSPALPHITELLALTDQEVLADACLALSSLTDGPNERIESIQTVPGLTERLIALLGHPAPQVQTPALRALGNMLTGTDVQKDRCIEAGCLDHIINFLKCDAPRLVKDAAWAASNILAGTHPQIQKALDKQILEPLINVLSEGDVKCQEEAAWAITNLCLSGTTKQLVVLRTSKVLRPYCRLLSSPDHSTVQLILDGLSGLLKKVKDRTVFWNSTWLQGINLPQLVTTLQQHEDEKVRLSASSLLQIYFPSAVPAVNAQGR